MDEKLYYKISEVSAILGESYATLRFWQKHFNLNIHTVNNIRYYTAKDIETLKNIQYLRRDAGYKVKGAKQKLVNDERKTTSRRSIAERLMAIRSELLAIRRELNTGSFSETVIVD